MAISNQMQGSTAMRSVLSNTIETETVHSSRLDQWGVNVFDYKMDGKAVDFQDLLVAVSKKRAVVIEGEVKPVATKVRERNNYLDKLGTVLSELSTIQASFDSDDKGAKDQPGWISKSTGELLSSRLGFPCTTYNSKSDRPSSNTGRADFYYATWEGKFSANKQTIEGMVQKVKSTIDALNNIAQTDMNRLQSIVERRDQAFTAATELMTNVSDSRSNLISNF
ncbi:MAG: hypothetical protein IJJ26_12155 [Victivallales bacterium]|nr:hypothetical protein [Victivallales bacterium]